MYFTQAMFNIHIQVGLALCQGYVLEKVAQMKHIIPIQNIELPGD